MLHGMTISRFHFCPFNLWSSLSYQFLSKGEEPEGGSGASTMEFLFYIMKAGSGSSEFLAPRRLDSFSRRLRDGRPAKEEAPDEQRSAPTCGPHA
jgi:hypothetical protein